MNHLKPIGLDRSDLSESFLASERHKSTLILEANLLQYQGQFEAASDKFAEVAVIEESLAEQLLLMNKPNKAFVHHFSALSCWVQAGELHHARLLGQQLLEAHNLSETQRTQIVQYLDTLSHRIRRWMSEWQSSFIAAD